MTFYKITLSFLVRTKLFLSGAAWLGSEGAFPQFNSYHNYNIKLFFPLKCNMYWGEQNTVQIKSLKIVMDC